MRTLWIAGWCLLGITAFLIGCSKSEDGESTEEPTYQGFIDQGWTAFAQGNYQTAVDLFANAKGIDSNESEAYSGTGWSFLRMDNLTAASAEFSSGAAGNNPAASLYGGWAFVLNAQKEYTDSNTKSDQALAIDPAWSFTHGLPLDKNDLHILKAENYFMVGDFPSSLAQVQILNPGFQANVTTGEGQAELAAEIERLKSVV